MNKIFSATPTCSIWPFRVQRHWGQLTLQGIAYKYFQNIMIKKVVLGGMSQWPYTSKLYHVFRLCSFPSPFFFNKPCDVSSTIKPFCYTRLKEVKCLNKSFTPATLILQNGYFFGDGNQHWGYCQARFPIKQQRFYKKNISICISAWQPKCNGEESRPESPYNLGSRDEVIYV